MKRRRRPEDHAAAVADVYEFQRQILAREYRRPSERTPLSSEEAAQVEMVSRERRDFAVIPPECMWAWGKENRW